ncbi:MAG: hypothetical protein RR954_09635, partial [Christensenellaceae bacterium]
MVKDNMENKLALLFDFQRYVKNEQLQSLISAVDARYSFEDKEAVEIDDTEMNLNAAGDISAKKRED